LIEGIRRKPIDREKEAMVHFVGFMLLIALMVVVTYLDIEKLIQ
jgi:regulator of sigma E protease